MVPGSGSPTASIRQTSMGAPPSARSAHFPPGLTSPVLPPPPLTPGGSIGRLQPLRRPNQSASEERNERSADDGQLENLEAQQIMRKEVYGPHDALDLLYKAATDRYTQPKDMLKESSTDVLHSPGQKRRAKENGSQHSPTMSNNAARDQRQTAPQSNNQPFRPSHTSRPTTRPEVVIDPALSSERMNPPDRTQDQGYKDALKAWARFRFVRAGWFTPSEAIAYID